jgi:CBS domain containing-hemolysin-like protein
MGCGAATPSADAASAAPYDPPASSFATHVPPHRPLRLGLLRVVPALRRALASVFRVAPIAALLGALWRPLQAVASVGPVGGAPIKSRFTPVQGAVLWLGLFMFSATLHSAESAITKISPWKVQEFADEEGPESPFATLSSNLTQLLSTILLCTTACSIYSTALFVASASDMFPSASLGVVTTVLTAVTLFFGELLPKALAVSNSELVARKLVPAISRMATVLFPITMVVTFLSDLVLRLAGMRSSKEGKEAADVSEDMLRMVVDEAQRSDTGIDTGEGRMIKAVLDMQDKAVGKIMKPRVDIVGVPLSATASDILKIVVENRYSRIPVYRGDVDNVVGIVYSKDLLDAFSKTLVNEDQPMDIDTSAARGGPASGAEETVNWGTLTAEQIMGPTYFIPETMTAWAALQVPLSRLYLSLYRPLFVLT